MNQQHVSTMDEKLTTIEWQGRWSPELVKDRPDLVSEWVSCPDEETANCFSEKRKRYVLKGAWIYR